MTGSYRVIELAVAMEVRPDADHGVIAKAMVEAARSTVGVLTAWQSGSSDPSDETEPANETDVINRDREARNGDGLDPCDTYDHR